MERFDPEVRDRFKDLKRVEPKIYDNSSIMEYKKCARGYSFRMVFGYQEKIMPLYFVWGTALHKFFEVLEVQTAKGIGPGPALLKAKMEAVIAWKKDYVIPKDPKNKYAWMTERRMELACDALYEWWLKEKHVGRITVIASEQPFTVELFDDVFIGGRADQIVKVGMEVYGRDLKSTSMGLGYWSRGLDPNHQFILYTYAEQELTQSAVKGQLILGLSTTKTQKTVAEQFTVNYTKYQIQAWKDEVLVWIKRIEESRKTDVYPPNENACWNCPFHYVCKQKGQLGQQNTLKRSYRFQPWDHQNVGQDEK